MDARPSIRSDPRPATASESLQTTLVDAADRALYRAKAAGRNAVAA